MNRTLMLVICDFLLLSMLALARFDPPEEAPEATLNATASSATAEAELIELLEESLQSELESRTNLSGDLTDTRKSLQEKERILAEREAALEATQQQLSVKAAEAETLAKTKAQIEADRARLAAEKAKVESERSQLAEAFEANRRQLESTQTEQVELAKKVGLLRTEASVNKERLSQTAEELVARELALAQREAELKLAQEEARKLAEERAALDNRLQIAQAEKALLEQNLNQQTLEKQQLQAEKEQAFARAERLTENVSLLGEGVTQLGQGVSQIGQGVNTLHQASEAIQKEMDASRPRTASEIFTRFQKNQAELTFTATEKTLFGNQETKIYKGKSILVTGEDATHLVIHSASTPFAFSKNPRNLINVQLDVNLAGRSFPVNQIGFLGADPRLIFVPVPQAYVNNSGLETFNLALQPERWESAVMIKNDESNFGQSEFRRLTSSERFLRMERPAFGELFADFATSRGDLAFTKNSQFIGVLTDSKHAVVIDAFRASGILTIGPQFSQVDMVQTMSQLADRVSKLPLEVR